jgi:phosphate transport system substrate-binding protein
MRSPACEERAVKVRTALGCCVRFGRLVIFTWLSSAVAVAAAQEQGELDLMPRYQPEQQVQGIIRLWGHGSFKSDFMGKLVRSWANGFAKYQPEIRLENKMYGTASAIGALYTGKGDVAILGEEISPAAAAAFERARHYAPTKVEIATGSVDVQFFDYAHVIFVHKDNPVSRLTLTQADAIFGAEHRRGPRNIRTWGELGLTGEWAARRIQPYGWKDLDFSLFIQEAMLGGSHRWNNDLKEFAHIHRPDGSIYEHGQQILDALANDRFGIAISNLRYANPQVKALALAARDAETYYPPTKENLIAQNYPLTRIIPAFIDRKPGEPVDPKVREFLRYILSREGQQAIVQDTGYLPLNARAIREQLDKLR